MSWLCPNCLNDQNDGSTIKCVCGYDDTTPAIQNEFLDLSTSPHEPKHDRWFRDQVESALAKVNQPGRVSASHEDVGVRLKKKQAALLKKAV